MTSKAIGKTRAALVVTTGTQAVAVITEVTAQPINDGNTERLRITGPAQWDPQIQQHIEETVLECVQRILKKVNITVSGFEISIANLNVSANYGNTGWDYWPGLRWLQNNLRRRHYQSPPINCRAKLPHPSSAVGL